MGIGTYARLFQQGRGLVPVRTFTWAGGHLGTPTHRGARMPVKSPLFSRQRCHTDHARRASQCR